MNSTKKLTPLVQLCLRRTLTRAAVVQSATPQKEVVHPGYKRIKEIQKKFQVDDGVPVYLKAGFRDKALFQTTLVLLLIAMGMSVHTVITLIFPPPPS